MGREVALIAPIYVKPYLKRGKNDANDAAAVCEAMSRPDMRFVPVKSADQQAALMLHKTRDLLVKQRTMTYERAARPPLGVRPDPPPRASTRSRTCWRLRRRTTACRRPRARPPGYWPPTSRGLRRASTLEAKIAASSASHPASRLLDEIPAFGPLIASAMVAFNPDPSAFRSASDFAASLGLTPSRHSSGGKQRLGGIPKTGNRYLRKMLVVSSTSMLRVAHKRKGALAEWIVAMRARKPERVAAVALANELARIAWAMMSTGECFRKELYFRA